MGEKNDTKSTDFVKRGKKKSMWINQNKPCIRTIKTEKSFEEARRVCKCIRDGTQTKKKQNMVHVLVNKLWVC